MLDGLRDAGTGRYVGLLDDLNAVPGVLAAHNRLPALQNTVEGMYQASDCDAGLRLCRRDGVDLLPAADAQGGFIPEEACVGP